MRLVDDLTGLKGMREVTLRELCSLSFIWQPRFGPAIVRMGIGPGPSLVRDLRLTVGTKVLELMRGEPEQGGANFTSFPSCSIPCSGRQFLHPRCDLLHMKALKLPSPGMFLLLYLVIM